MVYEVQENKDGQLILSHRKAMQARAWGVSTGRRSLKSDSKGFIKNRTRGGMIVEIFGVDAFLPGSSSM